MDRPAVRVPFLAASASYEFSRSAASVKAGRPGAFPDRPPASSAAPHQQHDDELG
jgi:hypothetical protein